MAQRKPTTQQAPAPRLTRAKAEAMKAAIERLFRENNVPLTPVTLLTLAYSTDIDVQPIADA